MPDDLLTGSVRVFSFERIDDPCVLLMADMVIDAFRPVGSEGIEPPEIESVEL